jgi:hypothetical protein
VIFYGFMLEPERNARAIPAVSQQFQPCAAGHAG